MMRGFEVKRHCLASVLPLISGNLNKRGLISSQLGFLPHKVKKNTCYINPQSKFIPSPNKIHYLKFGKHASLEMPNYVGLIIVTNIK